MSVWQRVTPALALLVLAASAFAQPAPVRDPTVPPAAAAAPGSGADAGNAGVEGPLGGSGTNVVQRDGKSYLVVGSRLVAPGQMIDGYKLERITETEIWLRDATGVTKVPRFTGIQRQPFVAPCPGGKPAAAATPQKKNKATAPRKAAAASSPTASDTPPPTRENQPHDCK